MGRAATAQQKDPELRRLVQAFLEAYRSASATSDADILRVFKSGYFSLFQGGAVELTEDLAEALSKVVGRATRLLGARAGNEKAIQELVQKHAQQFVINSSSFETAVSDLIRSVFDEGNATWEFIAPNYLIRFDEGVRTITVGRVRAAVTADVSAEIAQRALTGRLRIVPTKGFAILLSGGGIIVNMHQVCWVVAADAAADNVEEEAKWLIDVASSFLRLHYEDSADFFPEYGAAEPHPVRQPLIQHIGLKLQGTRVIVPGSSIPRGYLVGKKVQAITLDPAFCAKAATIFDPHENSLAERVSRGLGWLTRGRQAEDRAERLLYFFTAMEALLSSDDKSAPVVQTIARHAAVILSDEISIRITLSSEIRKLYSLRSALVHSGSRSVLWSSANLTQYFAEALFTVVLHRGDLSSRHAEFVNELSSASYGMPWRPLAISVNRLSVAQSALRRSRARITQ